MYDCSRHGGGHSKIVMEIGSGGLRVWLVCVFFFLMIRRPPRSTQSGSSAASGVYKRQ